MLITDNEKEICSLQEALQLAARAGSDLVEVGESKDMSICKIVDYGKYLYSKKKDEKDLKSKSRKIETKKIKFGLSTESHDFEVKISKIRNFISKGNRVECFILVKPLRFREKGKEILMNVLKSLQDCAKTDDSTAQNDNTDQGNKLIIKLYPK